MTMRLIRAYDLPRGESTLRLLAGYRILGGAIHPHATSRETDVARVITSEPKPTVPEPAYVELRFITIEKNSELEAGKWQFLASNGVWHLFVEIN